MGKNDHIDFSRLYQKKVPLSEATWHEAVSDSSDRTVQQEDIDYETWFGLNKATEKELQEQRKNPPEHGPLISIVVPVYRTPEIYLQGND